MDVSGYIQAPAPFTHGTHWIIDRLGLNKARGKILPLPGIESLDHQITSNFSDRFLCCSLIYGMAVLRLSMVTLFAFMRLEEEIPHTHLYSPEILCSLFWHITPYSLVEVYQSFAGAHCLHLLAVCLVLVWRCRQFGPSKRLLSCISLLGMTAGLLFTVAGVRTPTLE